MGTRDKLCNMIKKGQTLIEANCDVKTVDGYTVRIFCIAFTKAAEGQEKVTCYAQSGHIRKIRKQMVDIMTKTAAANNLRSLVKLFITESISSEIAQKTRGIFPLRDVNIRKCKVLKKPKFDITKFMEMHEKGAGDDVGAALVRPEAEEATNLLTAPAEA